LHPLDCFLKETKFAIQGTHTVYKIIAA